MGDIFREAGREREALLAYTSIVDLKPGDAAAHRMLGGIFQGMNRVDDAIEQYQAAKRARPEDQASYVALVSLYESKGEPAKAEEILTEGVKRTGLTGDLRTKLVATYMDRIAARHQGGQAWNFAAVDIRLHRVVKAPQARRGKAAHRSSFSCASGIGSSLPSGGSLLG